MLFKDTNISKLVLRGGVTIEAKDGFTFNEHWIDRSRQDTIPVFQCVTVDAPEGKTLKGGSKWKSNFPKEIEAVIRDKRSSKVDPEKEQGLSRTLPVKEDKKTADGLLKGERK